MFKTWDEYDDFLRNMPEDDWEEVNEKLEFVCTNCRKKIPRNVKSRDKKIGRDITKTSMYCQKCFRKKFHLNIEPK